MAEYIEREAALRVLCDACGNAACPKGLIPRCSYYEKMQSIPAADVVERASGIIGVIPAADVRPVVLCKDCKHRDPEDHRCDCGGMERQGCPFPVDDDYFCSYAEKREES